MSSLKFGLWGGGTETRSKNRGSEAHINWTCHMWTSLTWIVGIGPDLRKGRVTISCLFLRFVFIFKGNVLQNVNVLISKKCAYF